MREARFDQAVHDTGGSWAAWMIQGAIGGAVAGIVFSIFEMGWGLVSSGMEMAMAPLRMIGAIALGPSALDPGYSLLTAAVTGVAVHMGLSIAYGAAFGLAIGLLAPRARTGPLLVAGIAVGLALWIVNFYAIGPAAGWTWFAETDPVVQAIAHGGFFGAPLGLYVARFAPRGGEQRMGGSLRVTTTVRRTGA